MKETPEATRILGKLRAKPVRVKVSESEWNFDKEHVSESELIACCYWEYARESSTIVRILKARRVLDLHGWRPRKREPVAVLKARRDALPMGIGSQPMSCFGDGLLFLEWFVYPVARDAARYAGDFPPSWQNLTKDVRKARAHIPTISDVIPRVAFRRADCDVSNEIGKQACKLLEKHIAETKKVLGGVADNTWQWMLRIARCSYDEWRKVPPVPDSPSVFRSSGVESLVVQIDWAHFIKKDIVKSFGKWVKDNRPTDTKTGKLVGKHSDKGHDPDEWRTKLESLGLLRLRSRYSFEKAQPLLLKLGRKQKHVDPGECNREAKKAVAYFHSISPFLDPTENPRSWRMVD